VPEAVATFVNEVYEEHDPVERFEIALRRVYIERSYTGALEGTSVAELVTAGVQTGVTAYVALDAFSGKVDGREGTFVLSHRGTVTAEGSATSGEVVPGSGTGALAGLRGTAEITVAGGEHRLVLSYDL
jgi:hypothetical protein